MARSSDRNVSARALVGAIAVHGAIALVFARVHAPPEPPTKTPPPETTIAIEYEPSRGAPAVDTHAPSSSDAVGAPGNALAAPAPHAHSFGPLLATKTSITSITTSTASIEAPGVHDAPPSIASTAPTSDDWSYLGPKKKAWMPGKIGDGATLPDEPPPLDEKAKAAQVAAKVDKDLATASDKGASASSLYAGPAVTAAYSAAHAPLAPDAGSAVFTVYADGAGKVTSVSLGSFDGDLPGWSAVGKSIESQLAGKKLEVGDASKGVAITLKITAKYALPSGATSLVGKPSIGGTGLGGTVSVPFDLSDIGQKKTRQIAVVVTNEARL